jgi:hypothetical protein
MRSHAAHVYSGNDSRRRSKDRGSEGFEEREREKSSSSSEIGERERERKGPITKTISYSVRRESSFQDTR